MAIKRVLLIGLIPLLFLGCKQPIVDEEPEEYQYTMTAIQVCNYVEANAETPFCETFLPSYQVRQREALALTFDAIQTHQMRLGWWKVILSVNSIRLGYRVRVSCIFDEKTGRISAFDPI